MWSIVGSFTGGLVGAPITHIRKTQVSLVFHEHIYLGFEFEGGSIGAVVAHRGTRTRKSFRCLVEHTSVSILQPVFDAEYERAQESLECLVTVPGKFQAARWKTIE